MMARVQVCCSHCWVGTRRPALVGDDGKCPRCGYDHAAPLPREVRAVQAEMLKGLTRSLSKRAR